MHKSVEGEFHIEHKDILGEFVDIASTYYVYFYEYWIRVA